MSPNLFDKIAEAVEIIKAGKAVKVEVEDNVLVYKVVNVIRIDIKNAFS